MYPHSANNQLIYLWVCAVIHVYMIHVLFYVVVEWLTCCQTILPCYNGSGWVGIKVNDLSSNSQCNKLMTRFTGWCPHCSCHTKVRTCMCMYFLHMGMLFTLVLWFGMYWWCCRCLSVKLCHMALQPMLNIPIKYYYSSSITSTGPLISWFLTHTAQGPVLVYTSNLAKSPTAVHLDYWKHCICLFICLLYRILVCRGTKLCVLCHHLV